MRRWLVAEIAVSVLLVVSACAPTVTKREAFPAMYQEGPVSILVLPPINETTAADAKEYYSTTLAEPLSYMGYYVFPIEVVTDMMKHEGAYETETLMNVPPQKFREYFGADAVLFVRITKWDTSYYVIGGHVTVGVDFKLKSTTTGAELWKYDGVLQVSTGGGGGGGLAGLIVQVVVTAINTAMADYVPVAKRANAMVISTIPTGKYHPMHGQDQDTQIFQKK
jgi:hypothetical protein